jgi:NADH pyrophosphatase NudC (nudix superfamily)
MGKTDDIEYLRACAQLDRSEKERLLARVEALEAENAELKARAIAVSETMVQGNRSEHRSCPRDGTKMVPSRRRDGTAYKCPLCGMTEVVYG